METDAHIILVGLPGSGKTTLGKVLAQRVSRDFIDTDREIVRTRGKEIAEIFRDEGEAPFRKYERNCLISVLGRDVPAVISTGGGAPAYSDNMKEMNRSGITVYVVCKEEIIAARMDKKETSARPLFQSIEGEGILENLRRLKREREAFYAHAKLQIENNSSPAEVAEELLKRLRNFQDRS